MKMSQPENKNVTKGVKNVFAEFVRLEGGGVPRIADLFPQRKKLLKLGPKTLFLGEISILVV